MSQILTVNKAGLGNFGGRARGRNGASLNRRVLSMRATKSNDSSRKRSFKGTQEDLKKSGIFFAIMMVSLGIFYLYQVNDLTNKGYEMREIEKQIATLKKENEKNKIKEVELRSMYNIEKATENLNLVVSSDISYLELNGPMAMK